MEFSSKLNKKMLLYYFFKTKRNIIHVPFHFQRKSNNDCCEKLSIHVFNCLVSSFLNENHYFSIKGKIFQVTVIIM